MSNTPEPDSTDACHDCAVSPDRREFIQHAMVATLGALLAVGAPRLLAAEALPTVLAARRRLRGNPTYPIPAQDGVQIDKDNQVILVRWKNAIYAFNLSCPHQNTALKWREGDARFECPKHHSKYQPDGSFISGRATRAMDRFSVARTGNEIVVNVGAMHKSDADAAGWSASVIMLQS